MCVLKLHQLRTTDLTGLVTSSLHPPHTLFWAEDWRSPRPSSTYFLSEVIQVEAAVLVGSHIPLRVFVDSCVATVSLHPESTPRYPFITNHGWDKISTAKKKQKNNVNSPTTKKSCTVCQPVIIFWWCHILGIGLRAGMTLNCVYENEKMFFPYKVPERLNGDGIQVLLHAEEPRGQTALPAESLQVPPGWQESGKCNPKKRFPCVWVLLFYYYYFVFIHWFWIYLFIYLLNSCMFLIPYEVVIFPFDHWMSQKNTFKLFFLSPVLLFCVNKMEWCAKNDATCVIHECFVVVFFSFSTLALHHVSPEGDSPFRPRRLAAQSLLLPDRQVVCDIIFVLLLYYFFSVSLTGEKSLVALRTGGWRPAGTTWCAAAARPPATSRGATGGMRPLLSSRWRWRVRPAWAPSPWRGASWRWRFPQNQPLWAKRRRPVGQVRQTNEHPCWNKTLSGGSSLQLTGRTPLISSASYWSTALLCGAGVALAALVLASVAFCRKTRKSVSHDVPTWSEAIKAFLTEFSHLILFFFSFFF